MNKVHSVIRLLFILQLLPLLHSCSSSYVYDRLNWMVHWYVDDYVALDTNQKKSFNQRFDQFQEWHREQELKRYQQEFEELRAQLQKSELSRTEIGNNVAVYRDKTLGFWHSLVAEAEPHLLALAQELSPRQKQVLTRNIERDVRKRYSRKQGMNSSQWQAEQVRRLEKSLQPWFGSLTQEQDRKVRAWSAGLKNLDKKNFEVRLSVIAEVDALLQEPDKVGTGRLAQLISNPDLLRSQEHLQLVTENRLMTEQLITEMIATRTRQQEARMLDEIERWLNRITEARRG